MSFNLKLFFTFTIFGIFLAFFSVYSFSKVAHDEELLNKIKLTNELIVRKENKISTYVNSVDKHLLSIVNNKLFQNYIKDGSNKEYINELFKTTIFTGHGILQIKYINKNEDDVVSERTVNSNNLKFHISKRIDQQTLTRLKKEEVGSLWHSKIGLNIEKETIQKELVPIFVSGINLGHGVLRFYISSKKISERMLEKNHNIVLVDKSCNTIIDSKGEFSWSKYLNKDQKLDILLSEKDCKSLQVATTKTDKYISVKLNVTNSEDDAVLVLIYPDFGTIINTEMYFVYTPILIWTIIFAIILAYLFSKPMANMTNKIERLNNKLDKKVEQRTAQLKDSLRTIDKYVMRSMTDTDGVILNVSEAFCNVSQYSKQELIGQNHSIIRHPDTNDKVFTNMWATIQSGKSWDGKLKNLAKDGSYYWVKAHIEPNFINDEIVSYTAIRTKISNAVKLEELNKSLEKRIESEVKKSTEQLKLIQQEQLNSVKLSAIGTLSAGITHEINTPLTYIKGNFELMKYDLEDLPKSDLTSRILEDSIIITDGLNRISNIVEAMKEVSSQSSETVENINVYNTLITALTLSFNNAKQVSKIYLNGELFDINIEKSQFEFNAMIQKQRLEQVWIIIINNALDELVKKENYEERRLDISIDKSDDKIIIEFVDNAGGIKEDMIVKIFDPFISNKERGGMGIGLNVAKNIIDEHNGSITAENIKNGAKFRIEIDAEGAKC